MGRLDLFGPSLKLHIHIHIHIIYLFICYENRTRVHKRGKKLKVKTNTNTNLRHTQCVNNEIHIGGRQDRHISKLTLDKQKDKLRSLKHYICCRQEIHNFSHISYKYKYKWGFVERGLQIVQGR